MVGTKSREDIDYSKDIYRISCLWVTNSKGEILLARRKHTKKHDPGKWSGAVAGTVEDGETYESNIYKEAEEEIGLKNYTFTIGPKQFISHSKKFFAQWYFCVVDKPANEFVIQEDELEEVKWISKDALTKDINKNPQHYIKSMLSIINFLVKSAKM